MRKNYLMNREKQKFLELVFFFFFLIPRYLGKASLVHSWKDIQEAFISREKECLLKLYCLITI